MRKLLEYEEKQDCNCENCGYSKLKHFQRCPKCYSEAWHNVIKNTLKKKNEVEDE